jgi:hypothetical protein
MLRRDFALGVAGASLVDGKLDAARQSARRRRLPLEKLRKLKAAKDIDLRIFPHPLAQ